MEKLKRTRLWAVLHNLVDADNCPKQSSLLDSFVEELYDFCRTETNIVERTRSLNYVRNKLLTYIEDHSKTSKKKCTSSDHHP